MADRGAIPAPSTPADSSGRLTTAWLALCGSLALHVFDEASTGFLSVYNPTVLAARQRFPWFPMPVFTYRVWLGGLILAVLLLLLLTPFSKTRAFRPAMYLFAVFMIFNGLGHTVGTILGHTLPSIRFPRPMPGFYSSPFLFAASIFMLVELRRTAHAAR